jgi:hypothetical protein
MPGYGGKQLWLAVGPHSPLKLLERHSASIDARQRGSDVSDNLFQLHAHFRR